MAAAIRRELTRGHKPAHSLVEAFAFRNDERRFARRLLDERSKLWLFRTNQRLFCGDFIVVDMSARQAAHRRLWVLDLKQGAPLRVGGGGAGIQLVNSPQAVRDVATNTGAVTAGATPELLTGDRRLVWRYFGVHPG